MSITPIPPILPIPSSVYSAVNPLPIILTETELRRWLSRPGLPVTAAQALFTITCSLTKRPQNVPNN